jgi:predicted nucleic acid-binding protein
LAGYVIDTSAIMSVLFREEGGQRVEELFDQDEQILLPFVSIMEAQYKLLRDRPESANEMMAILATWPAEIIESDPVWREGAAIVKSRGRLSFADAWVASLALMRDAVLVHKDPEFDAVQDLKHLRLPYKETRE